MLGDGHDWILIKSFLKKLQRKKLTNQILENNLAETTLKFLLSIKKRVFGGLIDDI
jgi:hypothetical protein